MKRNEFFNKNENDNNQKMLLENNKTVCGVYMSIYEKKQVLKKKKDILINLYFVFVIKYIFLKCVFINNRYIYKVPLYMQGIIKKNEY